MNNALEEALSVARNFKRLPLPQGETNRAFPHIRPTTMVHWIDKGLVEWENERRDGRGTHREYGFANLLQIALVDEMTARDIPLDVIKYLMTNFYHGKEGGYPRILSRINDVALLVSVRKSGTKTHWNARSVSLEEAWELIKEGLEDFGFVHVIYIQRIFETVHKYLKAAQIK